nr:hypothetical protein [Tanacetum cinerariifolium]
MSTTTYVDSKTITQADGAQSSRVPIPLPNDPYVAVRQAHLVDTDTELDLKEAPSKAKESQPLGFRVPIMSEEFEASRLSGTQTVSSHSLVSSNFTAPLSPGHPLTHVSPTPTPTRVSFHRRTACMVVRGLDDESRGLDDKSQSFDDEGQGSEDKGPGLGYGAARHRTLESTEEITPSTYEVGQSSRSVPDHEGVERISAFRQPTLVTWVDPEDDRVYNDIPAYVLPVAPVHTLPSPEWSSSSLPISPSSLLVPSPIASPDHTQPLDALPPTLFMDIDRDMSELYTRSLWRPMLALEAWAGQIDAQRAALWHAIYDIQRENHNSRMQLAEERRERLELTDRVSRMERRQKSREENRESTRRNVPVKTPNSLALVYCDGYGGYDWSNQVEEGPNYALMAYFTSSSDYVSVEARLLVYKKNESVYEEDIKLLKCEIYLKYIAIIELRRKLELAQKQKDEIQLTVEKFKNSSKSLSKPLDSQIADKCKACLRYNVVLPPYTGNFLPPKPDLSGLQEFVNDSIVSEPTVKKPEVETSDAKACTDKPKKVRKNFGHPVIKDWISDSEDEAESKPTIEKKTVKFSFAK